MIGEKRDVTGTIAQRRHEDRNHIEPEVEILAEAAASNLTGQVFVGRRQHANVDADTRRAANRLDHLLLKRTQDFRLRLQAHVANLIEEQRSAVGELELAPPLRDGAGERPFHVAEQLALDQLFGDRRAIHLDERSAAPTAERMHAAGNKLLAGSVLTVDEHATVGRSGHGHLLAQLGHHVALPDHRQPAIDVLAQRAVLRLEPSLADRVADDENGFFERQRLLDEVEGAQLDGSNGGLDVSVSRNHDDRRIHSPFVETRQRGQPVHAGKPDVEDDDVVWRARDAIEARFTGVDGIDRVAFVAQNAAERATDARFVVDDEDRWFHVVEENCRASCPNYTGNSITNLVPCGSLFCTSMAPPCSAMMRRTMARPRPLPRCLVE